MEVKRAEEEVDQVMEVEGVMKKVGGCEGLGREGY